MCMCPTHSCTSTLTSEFFFIFIWLLQVEAAKKHIPYHMQQFGYAIPNIDFRLGYLEKLDQVGLQDNTFDIIM